MSITFEHLIGTRGLRWRYRKAEPSTMTCDGVTGGQIRARWLAMALPEGRTTDVYCHRQKEDGEASETTQMVEHRGRIEANGFRLSMRTS